ncbi:hypothetical protein ACFZAT_32770 [Streptomyces sp. NPDC008163]|uniref:hypothetical protein n=1 Tax=Streptomyces sp. NPDC008163 TaxID=3364818 RepID=UPI0036E16A85
MSLLADRPDYLGVVAVVTLLYQSGSALLVRGVLTERIHRSRPIGGGAAAVTVGLLAPTLASREKPGMPSSPGAPALDDDEWRAWIADNHNLGGLSVDDASSHADGAAKNSAREDASASGACSAT